MNRRQVGLGLAVGVAAAGAGSAALAEALVPMGPAERAEVVETARVGTLALHASRLALDRALSPAVLEFARFEVDEQTTIATILQEVTRAPPPPLLPDQRYELERLAAAGPGLERAYVAMQLDGHRRLLAVQDRYLAMGYAPAMRHFALLARGRILEHLALLADIERGRRA